MVVDAFWEKWSGLHMLNSFEQQSKLSAHTNLALSSTSGPCGMVYVPSNISKKVSTKFNVGSGRTFLVHHFIPDCNSRDSSSSSKEGIPKGLCAPVCQILCVHLPHPFAWLERMHDSIAQLHLQPILW